MNRTEVSAQLTRIFRDVLQREDLVLASEDTPRDVDGWDSFNHVEILFRAEELFGITLSSREIDSLRCFGEMVAAIDNRISKT